MAVTLGMTLNLLTGHVTSSNMSPVDRECTSLYSHFVVSFAPYHTVSEIFDYLPKNRLFHSTLSSENWGTSHRLSRWACGCGES